MGSNCSAVTWLFECSNNTSNSVVEVGRTTYWQAAFYCICGVMGITLNILALCALPQCKLQEATLALMRTQCRMNIIGLLPKTFVNPIVCVTGKHFPPQAFGALFNLPGALLVLAIYGQFALQALMAINRLVALCFPHRYPQTFSKQKTRLWITLAVGHGAWNFAMCMMPCCPCYFNPATHSWGYARWGSSVRTGITLVSDAIASPTMIVCYAKTFFGVKQMGAQIETRALSSREVKRELRLLSQFFAIACTWLAYSLVYRPISMSKEISTRYGVVVASEMVRFWMFSVDPVIYLIYMSKLRREVLKKVTCGRYKGIRTPSHSLQCRRVAPKIVVNDDLHVEEQAETDEHGDVRFHEHQDGISNRTKNLESV